MSQRGFTLIEMAMVFVLVGLVVGGGLFALAPVLDRTRINQTNATLDQAENALELFAVRFQRLPCPADGSLPNTDSKYGLEQYSGSPANGGGVTTGSNICTITGANAVIPWRTLGLDEAYSIDGWATRISYWPSGSSIIAGTTIVTNATSGPYFTHSGATGWPTGPFLTVTDVVSQKAVTPPTATSNDQAAYVLVSHGKSRWYGYGKSGSSFTATIGGTYKACNSTPASCSLAANSFASGGPVGAYPPSSNKYFDDIVRWRSPAMIIQLCGSGSCGNG